MWSLAMWGSLALLTACGDKPDAPAHDDSDSDSDCDGEEVCDGVDNDCDGNIDNDPVDGQPFYIDSDGDGYGSSDDMVVSCTLPPGYATTSGDCDDSDVLTYPGAASDLNSTDCSKDYDGDGFGDASPANGATPGTDCDDDNASVYPGAPEVCDGVDANCDGLQEEVDMDGDGQFRCDDCDDDNSSVWLGATELLLDDVDNDCDGTIGQIVCDVSVPTDIDTIQDAVQAASAGDVVCVEAGTYEEAVSVTSAITLVGIDGEDNTIIQQLSVDADAVIEGFTIAYDGSDSMALRLKGSVTVAHTTVQYLPPKKEAWQYVLVYVSGEGGWLHRLTVRDFSGVCDYNYGAWASGTLYVNASTLLITDSDIVDNFSCVGSALMLNDSTVTATNLNVSENLSTSSAFAGGIGVDGGSLQLSNSIISWNTNVIDDGWSCAFGGGLSTRGGSITLRNVAIRDNSTDYGSYWVYCGMGAGIGVNGGTLEADNVVITNNTSHGNTAGGIYVQGISSVDLRHTNITGNTAEHHGAIYMESSSIMTITDSIITDNTADSDGAVYSTGLMTVTNTNIYNNAPFDTAGFTFTNGVSGNRTEDPDFLSDGVHLSAASPLIDASTSGSTDPDGSTADLGALGGPGAGSWDVDADALYLWWIPGAWSDVATDEDDGW